MYLDADVSMAAHVTATVRACFAVLYQIRNVRSSLSCDAVTTTIHALVVSKLCTGWSIDNIAATTAISPQCRCSAGAQHTQHRSLLHELHWLKVPQQIQFRLCVLVYRCLHGNVPQYLAETLHLTANFDSRRCLCSGSTSILLVLPMRLITLGDRAF